MNTLNPSVHLLSKLGSLVVHYQELNSPGGHELDLSAIKTLEEDEDVKCWVKEMTKLALLPVKRKTNDRPKTKTGNTPNKTRG